MKVYNIFIPVPPQPWRRTRGSGRRRFTDPKSRAYKLELAKHVRASGFVPTDKPVKINKLVFQMPIPKSWTKAKKAYPPKHESTPDLDNLVKAVGDALNGVIWVDDAQIYECSASKVYSAITGIQINFEIPID